MSLAQWNARQLRVMLRIQRIYHVDLTWEQFRSLALRYARKHEHQRVAS